LKLPLVIEYNGSEVWVQKNWGRPLTHGRLAALAEDACLRHAHLVVTISEVLRDELVERGVEPRRIVCYPNCIDPRMFDPARFSAADNNQLRSLHQIAPDALVGLFLGTFGAWHGVEVLAETIRRLAFEKADWLRRHKLHFLLVGDGAKMASVRQTLSDRRCQEFYTLTGLVEQAEAPRYLAAADLLLSPHVANADGSRFFGSPTKLFEYMAMGKPIVASDLDQIGQVLRNSLYVASLPTDPPSSDNSELSLLCPPGDVGGLIRGIEFLAENPAWRPVLGGNARNKALSEFTWDRHVGAILEGYRAVVCTRANRESSSGRGR
jgi:glycosyltransferase involved in cell wall biosynthesis